jgi:hypothetical protein
MNHRSSGAHNGVFVGVEALWGVFGWLTVAQRKLKGELDMPGRRAGTWKIDRESPRQGRALTSLTLEAQTWLGA